LINSFIEKIGTETLHKINWTARNNTLVLALPKAVALGKILAAYLRSNRLLIPLLTVVLRIPEL
jgi:hypothetical protein